MRKLLKKHGHVKRKISKKRSTGQYKERNRQLKKINRLKSKFEREGNPIISVDTKKKEKLGNLYRDGQVYCLEAEVVYDHDFPNLAEGSVVPHGIYDLQQNDAMINIGVSAETSEFACDLVKLWWKTLGH